VTHDIRGIGKTQVFQWKFNLDGLNAGDQGPSPETNASEPKPKQ
jgi:hypothetical protein